MSLRSQIENCRDIGELWVIFEEMKDYLGIEPLLNSLADAMGTDALKENLEYIARMEDL